MINLRVVHAAVAALILCADGAAACSCQSGMSVDEARANAKFVIVGRVVSVDNPAPQPLSTTDSTLVESSGDMVRYAILPLQGWQRPITDTLIVYSARSGASCGFEMSLDGEYLLFVRSDPEPWGGREWAGGTPTGPTLTVSLCSRNKVFAEAAVAIGALGPATWRRKGH
jgi:hypothetical protein